jgi:iron(II)-dependent oxidoreductase
VLSELTLPTVEDLAGKMEAARRSTLSLFDLADEAVLHQSPGFGFRPIIWHLAHIGVFEAYWLLQKLNGEPSPNPRFEGMFDPIRTPRESSKDLPSRREMERFLTEVRERVLEVLHRSRFDSDDRLIRDGYLFQLVLEHEYQHQETLTYLFQMLEPEAKIKPNSSIVERAPTPVSAPPNEMVTIAGGPSLQGATGSEFAYDNEIPAHNVNLPEFRLARQLTTNAEYQEFIGAGGYQRREFWSPEGWEWREKEKIARPLYFVQQTNDHGIRTMFDAAEFLPDHPVSGVSWYEAEAYARYRGMRLPTETEWEKAASWDPVTETKRSFAWGDEQPNLNRCTFNNEGWGTTPIGAHPAGASAYGALDMTGNVWEWTSTEFAGYAGFQPFPYPEYSQEWFDGDHRVLKGGSWATRAPILRTSFRNFFRRNFRIGFAGIRLAADV